MVGFKPHMSHLSVFGSVVYTHVPSQLRKKVDDKGEKMILFGYHSMGGCKLYDAVNKRIVIIWDMIFYESRDWKHDIPDYQPTLTRYLSPMKSKLKKM